MQLTTLSHPLALAALLLPAFGQDECLTATTVMVGSVAPFDTSTATPSAQPWICDLNQNNDVWFQFTPALDGTFRIETCPTTSMLGVYEGDCANLVPIGCDDTRCRIEDSFARGGVVNLRGVAGQTYYCRVAPQSGSSLNVSGSLRVSQHTAPSGDECAGALPVAAGTTTPFDTFPATRSPEPAGCGEPLASDLWFEFVPTVTAQYQASTCGSSPITAVQVYQGSCASLTSLGCSSNTCSNVRHGIQAFLGVAGTSYHIRVFGRGPVGNGTLDLVQLGSAPNDECAGAQPVVERVPTLYDTRVGTQSLPSWPCAQGGAADIWYAFTPQTSGLFTAWAVSTDYSSAIEVFDGPCGALISADCDAGNLGAGQTRVEFAATAGMPSFLRVGGVNGSEGTGDLRVFRRPDNDDCADATDIALDMPVIFENSTASASPESWACATDQPRDVWYRFTAPATGSYSANSCGSAFSPLIEVYEGACGALTSIACPGASPCSATSTFFDAVAGQSYLVRVGRVGVGGPTGLFQVTVDPRPANDDCANAVVVTTGTFPFDTTSATVESSGWPCGIIQRPDVFYSFTPAISGRYRASTCGSSTYHDVSVNTGTCASHATAACSFFTCPGQGTGSIAWFDAQAGVPYLIRVSLASGSDPGQGVLAIETAPPPANDDCSGAIPIQGGVTLYDSSFATESAMPWACGSSVAADVWFRYTATSTGQTDFVSCGSSYFTVIEAYEGTDCAGLVLVGCNSFTSTCGFTATGRSALPAATVGGQDYWIRVGGAFGTASAGRLEVFEGIDPGLGGSAYCAAVPNSTGVAARMGSLGSSSLLANELELRTVDLPADVIGYYLTSRTQNLVAAPPGSVGNLCVGPLVGRYVGPGQVQSSGPNGTIDLPVNLFSIPEPTGFVLGMRGETWNWQLWYRDTVGGMPTSNFSNGITATLQ